MSDPANGPVTPAPAGRIRNIAVGLVVRDGYVLGEEYPAVPGHHRFVRAIGGGIEFGELAADAVRREFAEELGVTLGQVRLLGVVEDIFEQFGAREHEIAHVFAVRCPELDDLPRDSRLAVRDADTTVAWFATADLERGDPPFYPAGALALCNA